MLLRFIAWLFLTGRALTPRPDWLLCRTEHKAVIKPVIAHKKVTGELFIIEIGLCELRQVVTFLDNFIGEIFFIVILSPILVPEITYKVVRIFLAQIVALVVAPHDKRFLLGGAQILHRITQGKEVFRNPALAD